MPMGSIDGAAATEFAMADADLAGNRHPRRQKFG